MVYNDQGFGGFSGSIFKTVQEESYRITLNMEELSSLHNEDDLRPIKFYLSSCHFGWLKV